MVGWTRMLRPIFPHECRAHRALLGQLFRHGNSDGSCTACCKEGPLCLQACCSDKGDRAATAPAAGTARAIPLELSREKLAFVEGPTEEVETRTPNRAT